MDITFRKFIETDFESIEKWLKEAHVQEFWGSEDYEESYERYVYRTSQDESVYQYLIMFNNKPLGYIQYYWASKVGAGWWPNYPDNVVGFDFYIGEPTLLGKGLGKKIISQFSNFLFENTNATEIIGDPSPKNKKIHHLLTSCGFQKEGLINTPDGEAILYRLQKH